jgi:nucleotide sugar dehydrogenase
MKKIGVIGLGFVGSNLYKYFQLNDKIETLGFTRSESPNTFEETISADALFLCLPTPYIEGKLGYDLTAIEETLAKIPDGKLVIIKSTVLPGTTAKLQTKFPKLKLAFVPEFLTERFAWEDTTHPDTSIFGYTKESYSSARDILTLLPEAPFERIIPSGEAEMVKIARNNYFVNKIIFMNMLYDVCEEAGLDYEIVRDSLMSDRRIRKSHTEIWHQGGRGGGGTCFTKDTPAFADYVHELLPDSEADKFIRHYCTINKRLLLSTGKDTGRQYNG